ncbi:MAG: hypothetical protein V4502_04475 [Pseudomonadota bacterium]
MRRSIPLSLTLVLSACATRPQPTPSPTPPVVQPPAGEQGTLIGLTPQQLVARLGNPALQIREGTSVKLQFRNDRCVLDTYLYPAAGGLLRVSHVDARLRSGGDTNQAACIASLQPRSI